MTDSDRGIAATERNI